MAEQPQRQSRVAVSSTLPGICLWTDFVKTKVQDAVTKLYRNVIAIKIKAKFKGVHALSMGTLSRGVMVMVTNSGLGAFL